MAEVLSVVLPCPPPDNHCHRSGQYCRYPTAAYRDWLEVARPLVRAALPAGWEPDRECWWEVRVSVALGSRADAQNFLKPLLDLLSGAAPRALDPGKGKVEKPGLLWDDDGRVRTLSLIVLTIREPEPAVSVIAWPAPEAPLDVRAARLDREREQKAAVRAAQRGKRPVAAIAEKERLH